MSFSFALLRAKIQFNIAGRNTAGDSPRKLQFILRFIIDVYHLALF